jgi:hypothetical protein
MSRCFLRIEKAEERSLYLFGNPATVGGTFTLNKVKVAPADLPEYYRKGSESQSDID